jgi:hypothetical protein
MTNQFSENSIRGQFESNLNAAKAALASLDFCCSEASFLGLTGWVFEQTVHGCLRKELEALGVRADFREQPSIGGRAKAHLLIGGVVAVEVN